MIKTLQQQELCSSEVSIPDQHINLKSDTTQQRVTVNFCIPKEYCSQNMICAINKTEK